MPRHLAAPAFCAASKPQKAGAAARPSCFGTGAPVRVSELIRKREAACLHQSTTLGSDEEVQGEGHDDPAPEDGAAERRRE